VAGNSINPDYLRLIRDQQSSGLLPSGPDHRLPGRSGPRGHGFYVARSRRDRTGRAGEQTSKQDKPATSTPPQAALTYLKNLLIGVFGSTTPCEGGIVGIHAA
jgi:hypothetical protein